MLISEGSMRRRPEVLPCLPHSSCTVTPLCCPQQQQAALAVLLIKQLKSKEPRQRRLLAVLCAFMKMPEVIS